VVKSRFITSFSRLFAITFSVVFRCFFSNSGQICRISRV
jgi:hypothetical protein